MTESGRGDGAATRELSARAVVERARDLERRDFAMAQQVGHRLDLYYVQWRVPRRSGREFVPHPMGRFVMDRAMDKLLSTPHRLSVAPLPDLLSGAQRAALAAEVGGRVVPTRREDSAGRGARPSLAPAAGYGEGLTGSGAGAVERRQRRALEELLTEEAQWQADRSEMALGRLLSGAEQDAGLDLTEAVVWSAVVAGYAGPTRVGFDEMAAVGEGESPLVVQALDRRFYHEVRGAHGPKEVLYSRQGTLKELRAEGWMLDLPGRPDAPAALHDYWWVERTHGTEGAQGEGEPRWPGKVEVWHAMVAEVAGGTGRASSYGELVKPPTRMEGLSRIPYALRMVRPAVIRRPEFEAFEANAFADVLWLLFEPMSRVLSWSHQLAHLAAEPAVTVATRGGVPQDVDVVRPGTLNTVSEGTEVTINLEPAQAQVLGTQGTRLNDLAEKSTFAGAALGQGIYQSSGLMTSRLQDAGAESLISTRKACMGVLADTYRNLAMVARAYAPHLVRELTGREQVQVELPSISRREAIELLGQVRRVTQPDARGVGLVSEDTGLELVGLPYPALEERKKRRQRGVWGLDSAAIDEEGLAAGAEEDEL